MLCDPFLEAPANAVEKDPRTRPYSQYSRAIDHVVRNISQYTRKLCLARDEQSVRQRYQSERYCLGKLGRVVGNGESATLPFVCLFQIQGQFLGGAALSLKPASSHPPPSIGFFNQDFYSGDRERTPEPHAWSFR